MLTAIIAFATVFLLIVTTGLFVFNRSNASRRLAQIAVSQSQAAILTGLQASEKSARVEKLLRPFRSVLPRSAKEVSKVQRQLARAGYREARHLNTYYA